MPPSRHSPRPRPEALLLLGLACASPATLQSSRTLGRGTSQGTAIVSLDGAYGTAGGVAYPSAAGAYARGLTDTVDLRISGGGHGVGVGANFALFARPQHGPAAAFTPTISGAWAPMGGAQSGYATVALPVVLGWTRPTGTELIVAPTLLTGLLVAGESPDKRRQMAGGAGLAAGVRLPLRHGLTQHWEVSWMAPTRPSPPVYGLGGGNLGAPYTTAIYAISAAIEWR